MMKAFRRWFLNGKSMEIPADTIKIVVGLVLTMGLGYALVDGVGKTATGSMSTLKGLDTQAQSNPFSNNSGVFGGGGGGI